MAESMQIRSSNGETILRRRVKNALTVQASYKGIASTLECWQQEGWGPILFGGFLRDLMLFGRKQNPRDIDIVLRNRSVHELQAEFRLLSHRQNRFGGFHVTLSHWHCDVWPLETTWAFHHLSHLRPSIENLPKTTFLNIEAVAVGIGKQGEVSELYESGFFKALKSKILEINLEDNPYPSLAAVRSLLMASKLNFAISPRLCQYILNVSNIYGVASLVEAQKSHYGEVRLREEDLDDILRDISLSDSGSPDRNWKFKKPLPKQLSLVGFRG